MGAVGRRDSNPSDRTPEHDALSVWLYEHYAEAIPRVLDQELEDLSIDLEPALLPLNGCPLLFPDGIVRGRASDGPVMVVVEIKPRIDSLGSTLRQVKLYLKRLMMAPKLFAVLVTETTQYDSLLRQQGIYVLHPGFSKDVYPMRFTRMDEPARSKSNGWDEDELYQVLEKGAKVGERDLTGYRLALHWLSAGGDFVRKTESGRTPRYLDAEEVKLLLLMWGHICTPPMGAALGDPNPEEWAGQKVDSAVKFLHTQNENKGNPTFELRSIN